MADYYHEARKAKRALKDVSLENKRRREQRREEGLEPDDTEHPLNLLEIAGRAVKLHRNADQHAALERQDGLIPWNGDAANLIDRFDARALLDFYKDPPPPRPRTAQEEKLHELVLFESYRDLVALVGRGLSEAEGLAVAHDDNLAIRASRRSAASAAFRVMSHQQLPGDHAAGTGMYAAVGFAYGGATTAAAASESSSDSDDDGSGSDDDDSGVGPQPGSEQAAAEAEQDRLDALAEAYGVPDFTYRLHRVQQAEGEEGDAWGWKPRKRTGRQKAALRARRLAGQGLDAQGRPLARDWRDPLANNAPSAFLVKPRRPSPTGRRSRSSSPARAAPLSLPSVKPAAIDRKAFEREEDDDNGILDALPDEADPARKGAQFFPAEAAMQALREVAEAQRRQRDRSRSRSRSRSTSADRRRRERAREREWSRRYSSRSRSRSRERRRRSRSTSRERRRYGRSSRSISPGRRRRHSRSWSPDRRASRSRSRGRDKSGSRREGGVDGHARHGGPAPGAGQQQQSTPASGSGRGGAAEGSAKNAVGVARAGSGTTPAAAAVAAGSGGGSGGGSAPVKGETPAERLKRIMAAQLAKQSNKDSAVTTQRRLQDERDRQVREQIQRQAMSPPRRDGDWSPPRGRDRGHVRDLR